VPGHTIWGQDSKLEKSLDNHKKVNLHKAESIFPIMVSIVLLILIGIGFMLSLSAQSKVFVSVFQRLFNTAIMIITIILSVIWMLMLVFESYNIPFGKLLKTIKAILFFFYYPLGRFLAMLVRISPEVIQTSFIAFQNRLFFPNSKLNKDSRLLLLLPHCLQYHDCKVRLTRNINDCEDCGECDICNIKDLGKEFEIKINVATGGTLARKIVNDTQPDAIIAVACHRDLTDGIRESWRYPVYAILNERPFGPCYDTKVDVDKIRHLLEKILT